MAEKKEFDLTSEVWCVIRIVIYKLALSRLGGTKIGRGAKERGVP